MENCKYITDWSKACRQNHVANLTHSGTSQSLFNVIFSGTNKRTKQECDGTNDNNGGLIGALGGVLGNVLLGSTGPRGGRQPGLIDAVAKSAMRSIGSQVGREIVRGVLGSLLGGGRKR